MQMAVLASNYHNPQGGGLGSGIYDGRRGVLAYTSVETESWTSADILPNQGTEKEATSTAEQNFREPKETLYYPIFN
jgi:hypothetical protein